MSLPDWRSWSWAVLRGYPPPLDGPRYAALLASIHRDGVQCPILVDASGVVWDGRSRHRACLEAGVEPAFQLVADGPAAARRALIHRQLTVLERSDLLAHLREVARDNLSLRPEGRESEQFSAWLGRELGWTYGYSWKNLDRFRKLHRVSPADRARIAAAEPETVHQALRVLRQPVSPLARPDVDGAEHLRVIESGSAFLDALEGCPSLSQATAGILGQVRAAIGGRLRRA